MSFKTVIYETSYSGNCFKNESFYLNLMSRRILCLEFCTSRKITEGMIGVLKLTLLAQFRPEKCIQYFAQQSSLYRNGR